MFRGRKEAKRERTVHSEDAELFARHLQGDHSAFIVLFDKYNERLWLYCTRMLGDPQLGMDAVQELWEKVILLRKKNNGAPTKPLPYLFTIARNLCLNQLRSRKEFSSIDDLAESEHPTEGRYEPSQLEELVVLALQKMPESQKEILVLNAYVGYSFEEISELLDKPLGAIHTAAWRARKRLGVILEEMVQVENRNVNR